jgi:flagellar hook-basal body complex protein FliE
MEYLKFEQVSGNKIEMKRTDPRHLSLNSNPFNAPALSGTENKETTFESMMFEALNGVNKMQQESDDLNVRMITDPDSLDAHDITIAMAKANTALAITKAVIDRGIKAYKEILSIR